MATAITGVGSGQPAYQPQQVTAPKQAPKEAPKKAAPQHKSDVVTISAQGKQAVQLRAAGSTPGEEAKESPIEKSTEAQIGKK